MPALEIDLVEYAPKGESTLIVYTHGAWSGRKRPRRRPVLVVDVGGSPRRFPPIQGPRHRSSKARDDWSARFAVPAWLGPSLDGSTWLSFGEGHELIPLPSPSEPIALAQPAARVTGRSEGATEGKRQTRLERRPVSENGRISRVARVREQGKRTGATADLQRELERLRHELREARAARDKYYETANGQAKHVATMHSRLAAVLESEKQMTQERDRLAGDLASLQAELHAVEGPSKRSGSAEVAGDVAVGR